MNVVDRLERIFQRPEVQVMADKMRDEDLEARRSLYARCHELQAELARTAPMLRDAIDQAERQVTAAKEALASARGAHAEAQAAYTTGTQVLERQIQDTEAALLASASPQLAESLTALDQLEYDARHALTFAESKARTGESVVVTNAARVERRLAAIRSARLAVRRLRLEALSEADIRSQVNGLLAGLPALYGADALEEAHV